MSNRTEVLTTYLDDHLAGSVAAIELLEHLRELSKGLSGNDFRLTPIRDRARSEVLKELLRAVGGSESKLRKAAAWLTEKVGEAKLKLDDPGGGDLRLLEAFEILELGILGKLGLWRALGVAAGIVPEIAKLNLRRLEERAQAQHKLLEAPTRIIFPAAWPNGSHWRRTDQSPESASPR